MRNGKSKVVLNKFNKFQVVLMCDLDEILASLSCI